MGRTFEMFLLLNTNEPEPKFMVIKYVCLLILNICIIMNIVTKKFCISYINVFLLDVFFKEPPAFTISSHNSNEVKRDSVFHSLSCLSHDEDNYEFPR